MILFSNRYAACRDQHIGRFGQTGHQDCKCGQVIGSMFKGDQIGPCGLKGCDKQAGVGIPDATGGERGSRLCDLIPGGQKGYAGATPDA